MEGREICWGDGHIMEAGGPDKRTDSAVTEKMRGVQRRWKWQKKTDRRRYALELEDDNNGSN